MEWFAANLVPEAEREPDLGRQAKAVEASLRGVQRLLSQRYSLIAARSKVGEEDKELLGFLEAKIYGFMDGLTLPDKQFTKWLDDYKSQKGKQVLKNAASRSANRGGSYKDLSLDTSAAKRKGKGKRKDKKDE